MRIFTAREKGFVLGQANEDLKSFTECEAGGARTNKEICKYEKIPLFTNLDTQMLSLNKLKPEIMLHHDQ